MGGSTAFFYDTMWVCNSEAPFGGMWSPTPHHVGVPAGEVPRTPRSHYTRAWEKRNLYVTLHAYLDSAVMISATQHKVGW